MSPLLTFVVVLLSSGFATLFLFDFNDRVWQTYNNAVWHNRRRGLKLWIAKYGLASVLFCHNKTASPVCHCPFQPVQHGPGQTQWKQKADAVGKEESRPISRQAVSLWCYDALCEFLKIEQNKNGGVATARNFDIVWWQYSSIFLPRRNSIKRTYLFVWNHDQRDCEADDHKKEELFRIAFSHAVGCSHWSWSCPNGGYNGHGNVYTLPGLRWASIQPLCLSRMSLAGTSSVLPRWST